MTGSYVILDQDYIWPTSDGEMRARFEDWGVIVTDMPWAHGQEHQSIRLPYKILADLMALAPEDR